MSSIKPKKLTADVPKSLMKVIEEIKPMRNRAKCKLCDSIIESFIESDYVTCQCGEIAISGGAYRLDVYAKDFVNFFRLDDADNIIVPVVKEKIESKKNMKKEELLETLDHMVKTYEQLPSSALSSPMTHYDALSILTLISALLRCD